MSASPLSDLGVSHDTRALRVLFDQQIMYQRYGGVSRYVLALLRELNRLPGVQAELAALAHVNGYIRPDDALHRLSFELQWPRRGARFRAGLSEPLFRLASRISQPDIVHETGHIPQAEGRPGRAATVTTLHDMIVERYPQLFVRASQQADERLRAMRRAQAIICISHNTRKDLLERYPEFEPRTHVVWHGVDPTVSAAPRPANLPRPYLLFVGMRSGYKNFGSLLKALGSSPRLRGEFDLVCFGGGAFTTQEHEAARAAGVPLDHLQQRSGPDEALAALYCHARAFVFPSLYEGFGMPLTEAMVQGCPVVCSRASSFPEIAADAAAYFQPDDIADMRGQIESVALSDARRKALSDLSLARAAAFSWTTCAQQTLQAYRSAVA
jgi:glycosyltransferase involved in cell wall biosynthesis